MPRSTPAPPLSPRRGGRCFYGLALIETGDPESGRAHTVAGGGGPELSLLPRSIRSEWYANRIEADLGLGRLDAAEETVSRAEASAAAVPMAGAGAYAQLARASLMLARGGFEKAGDLALAAAAAFDGIEQPPSTALVPGRSPRALSPPPVQPRARSSCSSKLARASDPPAHSDTTTTH